MKRSSLVITISFLLLLCAPYRAVPCVGRVLTLIVTDAPDQTIVANLLSVLITERTGTAVEIVKAADLGRCHDSVQKGEANIFINYVGQGLVKTGNKVAVQNPEQAYTLVTQQYMEEFGMVWLKPLGFSGPVDSTGKISGSNGSMAAPVTTKEVLSRFPVLDRVINKLSGKLDNATIAELRERAKGKDVKETAREFLKGKKII